MNLNQLSKFEQNGKKTQEFPDKKDMTYWLIGIILLGIFVYVLYQNDPSLLNSKLSLTGTIVSIVLAVIAIFFSFIQSTSSSNQLNDVLDRSAVINANLNEITNTIEDLEKVRRTIEAYNNNLISSVSKIEGILTNVNDGAKETSREGLLKMRKNILEEVKEFQRNDIPATFTVSGKNAIYNTIINNFGNKSTHIQVLWKALFDSGVSYEMKDLKAKLFELEEERKILFENDYIKILE